MTSATGEVVMLPWPKDHGRRAALHAERVAVLWLVSPGEAPPADLTAVEDWARTTADAIELQARRLALADRLGTDHGGRPAVDDDGIVRWRDDWVALGPVEARVARVLLERLGSVVSRADLIAAGWPTDPPTRALDVALLRLRRHLAPLGIAIENIRGHGYLAEPANGGRLPQ